MVERLRVCVFVCFFVAAGTPEARAQQDGQAAAAAVQDDEETTLPVMVMLIGSGARFRNIHLENDCRRCSRTRCKQQLNTMANIHYYKSRPFNNMGCNTWIIS